MKNKLTKIQKLNLEIAIRDKLLGNLLKIIAEKEIAIPDHLLTTIQVLYNLKPSEEKKAEEEK